MIKLIDLLLEAANQPKAIIMAGGAGAGKTTFVNQIQSDLDKNNWETFNPDNYIEGKKQFPDTFIYQTGSKKGQKRDINLSNASIYIKNTLIPKSIESQVNFLYDTTAADVQGIKDIANKYKGNIIMVMVYAHPIVSFLRNFARPERMVPAIGVLTSWNSTYKTIDDYSKMLGNNFYLVQTGISAEEQNQIDEFNKAYESNNLKEYFNALLSTGKFKSTFRKEPEKPKSPEEIEKYKEKFNNQVDELANQFREVQNNINQLPNKNKNYSDVVNTVKNFINL